MKDHKIEVSLIKFQKACVVLQEAAHMPKQNARMHIDATIHRFEFTIELFWKLLKNILESKGVEVRYPRDVLKEAYAGGLIDNEEIWLSMLNDRNMTSHVYDEEIADQIYVRIKTYVPVLMSVMKKLSAPHQ